MDEQDPDSLAELRKALDDAFPSSQLPKSVRRAAVDISLDFTKNLSAEDTMATLRRADFAQKCLIAAYKEVEDEKNQYIQKQNDYTHVVLRELLHGYRINQASIAQIAANTDPKKTRKTAAKIAAVTLAAGVPVSWAVGKYFETKLEDFQKAVENVIDKKISPACIQQDPVTGKIIYTLPNGAAFTTNECQQKAPSKPEESTISTSPLTALKGPD
ncbi:MAG: hypothetical protein FWF24_00925 [Alphaproteobacteria bacterium]|nr:hypothetical protein [Alphaproteobacteria bacterium]